MNPQDPFAALNPLREPAQIDWWPLAPGWWLLLALLLLSTAGIAFLYWRRRRKNAYRRQALRQLRAIQEQCHHNDPTHAARNLSAINALLKSVALLAYPRRTIAASTGKEWLAFLNSSLAPDRQLPESYTEAIYQCGASPPELESIYRSARTWILRHKGGTP